MKLSVPEVYWFSSPLTGLPHVKSSELPFFRVEKSESSDLSVLRVAQQRKKTFRRETE